MALAYPGHFIMPWTLYFLTDIAKTHPFIFYPFMVISLCNSAFHFLMGITYPLNQSFLGDKKWDRIYITTIVIEALSFTLPALVFQKIYGVWSQETLFATLLWVVGLEGFAKFCYHFPRVFTLAFALMVLPMAIISPIESGSVGLALGLSAIGYSFVVFQGAMASYKQSMNLYDTSKRAKRDEAKLKDLLHMSSFTILEVNADLDIVESSRAPIPPQVNWYLPIPLKIRVKKFQEAGLNEENFEMSVRLEKKQKWYQFNLRQKGDTTYVVAHDIHEQKLTSIELEEQKVMHINNAKLAALGEMAGGIAHEVNNPLTILSGNVMKVKRLLKSDSIDRENIINSLEKMEMTIKRISKVILGLRNLSHPGHASKEKTNIERVIEDTLGLCQEKFLSKGVHIQEPKRCFKEGSPQELFIKAGHVEVGQGTGLGLSLSRKIAESHGGTLHYKREGNLTVFSLCLPKWSEDSPEEVA